MISTEHKVTILVKAARKTGHKEHEIKLGSKYSGSTVDWEKIYNNILQFIKKMLPTQKRMYAASCKRLAYITTSTQHTPYKSTQHAISSYIQAHVMNAILNMSVDSYWRGLNTN